ncbi:MAG: CvpA family protein [Phycisphaerales bacterium JB037]
MSLIVIAIALGLAALWMVRGFFSSFLHMICVIAAGAIAFALWEPLAYLILEKAPKDGFLAFIESTAWGVALVVPFAFSLAILRVLVDKAIPANAQLETLPDYIGGAICGLVTGTITAGILAMGVNMLWFGTSFMGHQRLEWDSVGSTMKRQSGLMFPADDLVAKFYGGLSTTVFEPKPDMALARQYPDLSDVPGALRFSLGDGEGRNTFRPGQFTLTSVYTLGLDDQGNRIQSVTLQSMLQDKFNTSPQPIQDRDGEAFPPQSYIAGFVTQFQPAAREKGISIVALTPAQARLVCAPKDGEGEWKEVFPAAVITRSDPDFAKQVENEQINTPGVLPGAGFQTPDEVVRYRLEKDAIASVSSEASPTMAIEFVVPAGYEPATLYLRNVRVDVRGRVDQRFRAPTQRNILVESGELLKGGGLQFTELEGMVTVQRVGDSWNAQGITTLSNLPGRTLLHKSRVGGLTISKRDEQNVITDGIGMIPKNTLAERDVPKALQVSRFGVTEGSAMVQVTMMPGNQTGVDPATELTRPPYQGAPQEERLYLIDTNGTPYPAVGYIYTDVRNVYIRYTLSRPLGGLADLPNVPSRPNPAITLIMLFEVTADVEIEAMAIGDKIYTRFEPPIEARSR